MDSVLNVRKLGIFILTDWYGLSPGTGLDGPAPPETAPHAANCAGNRHLVPESKTRKFIRPYGRSSGQSGILMQARLDRVAKLP